MKQLTRRKEARTRRRGQALIEMAAGAVILILLTMGIIQFGMIYSTTSSLTNLAREGARFAAIHGTNTSVVDLTRDYVQTQAMGTNVRPADLPDANIEVFINDVKQPSNPVTVATAGKPIKVVLTYNMRRKFFLPIDFAGFLADTNNRWSQFKQQATMTIE